MRFAVVAGPDPGHCFPAAALAVALTAAGHEVRLHTGTRWAAELTAAGIEVRPLPGLAAIGPDEDFGARLHERAGRMAPLLAAELSDVDVVVGDVLTAAAGLAADLAGLPWVELVPHLLHLPSRALPPFGMGVPPGRGVTGRTRDRVLRALTARSAAAGTRQRAAVRGELGLPPDRGPAARLVATWPGLEPPRPDWPARTHLVGPLAWEPPSPDLEPPPGDDPLVLVSPPTATSGRAGLLDAALQLENVRLVATLLQPYDGDLPHWARAGRAAQGPLLAQAAVVVAGGGHGMVAKTLGYGVPLVLLPGGGDQREVAYRVQRAGAGLVVREPDEVRTAVENVLSDPSYAANARTVAAERATADPVTVCERAAGTG